MTCWLIGAVAADLRKAWGKLTRDRAAILNEATRCEQALADALHNHADWDTAAAATAEQALADLRRRLDHAPLRLVYTADQERLATYSGDHPKCGDCVIGWDGSADRSHLLHPCAAYPRCSQPDRRRVK